MGGFILKGGFLSKRGLTIKREFILIGGFILNEPLSTKEEFTQMEDIDRPGPRLTPAIFSNPGPGPGF